MQSLLLKRPEQDSFVNRLQQTGAEFAMNAQTAIRAKSSMSITAKSLFAASREIEERNSGGTDIATMRAAPPMTSGTSFRPYHDQTLCSIFVRIISPETALAGSRRHLEKLP
jgi:hypothetical protein